MKPFHKNFCVLKNKNKVLFFNTFLFYKQIYFALCSNSLLMFFLSSKSVGEDINDLRNGTAATLVAASPGRKKLLYIYTKNCQS